MTKVTIRMALALGLLVVGVYSMTLNSWNANKYLMQNAAIAAMVERRSLSLVEQEIPGFELVVGTEAFRIGEKVYPIKQPGQAFLGSVIYFPLYKLNINFDNHYHYASHAITWLTSILMTAVITAGVYLLALELTKNRQAARWSAVIYAFATISWPYGGVTHHDVYGTFWSFLSVGAYYLAQKTKRQKWYFWAGTLSTWTLFFTLLPISLPLTLWALTYFGDRKNGLKILSWGMVVGLIPTLTYNYLVVGNLLLVPNVAGEALDTLPNWSLANLIRHLYFFLLAPKTSLSGFMPVLWFGVAGLLSRKARGITKRLLGPVIIVQILQVSLMSTYGGSQYGPRYLLTILPYLSLGTAYYIGRKHEFLGWAGLVLSGGYAFFVALLGALRGVMYEITGPYAPTLYFTELVRNEGPEFRLFIPGIILTLIALTWINRLRKAEESG